jgi:UDP-N-acetylglucosamine 2-epimerase (non-hydrolysing)
MNGKIILITAHRRENFGKPLTSICEAISSLAKRYPTYQFIYSVHPNPNVKNTVHRLLSKVRNVILTDPLDYLNFVFMMKQALLILTDSGGIQEEAPSLGKPLLVLRDKTERQELIDAGGAKLVGTDRNRIVSETCQLIEDKQKYREMVQIINPFGDGTAAQKIVQILQDSL